MSEFSTRFWWRPLESRNTDSQHRIRECNYDWRELRSTDSQHHTRKVIIMINMSHKTQNHITLERNYYYWRVVRREVQRKSSVAPPDFYGMYDPRKFCDWIAHVDYYFDLYEFSYARRVQFAK